MKRKTKLPNKLQLTWKFLIVISLSLNLFNGYQALTNWVDEQPLFRKVVYKYAVRGIIASVFK